MTPDPDAPLTVEEARTLGVCRYCKGSVRGSGRPAGLTLNYGKEFAHTGCLPPPDVKEGIEEAEVKRSRVKEAVELLEAEGYTVRPPAERTADA